MAIWAAIFGLALIVSGAVRAFLIEPNRVEVVHQEIEIPGLDPGLDGVRIVHLSDLHMRRYDDKERQVVAAVRGARPDLLCLTGDYVEETGALALLAPFLMEIARGRPAFAVLGNHDHLPEVDLGTLVSTLERSGVRVLINDRTVVSLRGVRIDVVGVDDPHTERDDLDAALDRTDLVGPAPRTALGNEQRFRLLLAHSPDIVSNDRAKTADLILCGHTHGGQVRAPFIGALRTNTRIGRRAAGGLAHVDGARLYVTRGVGESGMRARFGCRPEVSVLTLRRS